MSKVGAFVASVARVVDRWRWLARSHAAQGLQLALVCLSVFTGVAVAGHQVPDLGGAHVDARSKHQRVVRTQAGYIKGFVENGAEQFLGVPYAKPPVGELRWANPVALEPWPEVRDATAYASPCPQQKTLGNFSMPSVNEDCLYLNVYVPRRGRKHPVMVWLHGGGSVGHGNGYDGSVLAREQGVLVVTLNHRIGALGDLVHPAFDNGGATTLYELRDQQFALKWIKDNIAVFGGDPDNVTLFGESIGGASIQLHMVSPTAKGLFHKAIFQSGPSRYYHPLVPLAEAEARAKVFATAVGCTDQSAECLRNVPVSAILEAQGSYGGACCATFPVDDGHVLTSTVYEAIRSGQFNRVPFLDVTNRDEHRWFLALTEVSTSHSIAADEYPARLQAAFGADAAIVQAAYPLSQFDSPSGALAAAQGDRGYPCQVRNFDVDASKYVRVYAAEFNDPTSAEAVLPAVSFPYLSAHTHEIPYIFPGWKGAASDPLPPLNRQQQKLARQMRELWATFAETGELRDYPALTKSREAVISLEIPRLRVITDFSETHRCQLWNSIRNWTPVP
ncbi:carboxylesterase/lipase family protein [Peristeroidobacter soli]|uniref:carboxylesterase/lipase family protein n=1 Tax=Peristeroidobacter soli TaxID=2497877 RepID=UPI00101CD24F|nr:carboxylesterase family protein [Peristeroidobacter soli]